MSVMCLAEGKIVSFSGWGRLATAVYDKALLTIVYVHVWHVHNAPG